MLFKSKSWSFVGLLIASQSVFAGLGALGSAAVSDADVKIISSSRLSQELHPADSLHAPLTRELLLPVFLYADSSFSGAENPQFSTTGGVDAKLIAYVPLPTTAWCFLIGLMTLLGLSKRRHASHG
jgi:hypothetical protein